MRVRGGRRFAVHFAARVTRGFCWRRIMTLGWLARLEIGISGKVYES
jgi:hypothetical protein